jgi:hypothetical protein
MTRKGGVRRDGPADHIHASHHNSTGVCYANRSGMHLDLAEVEGGVPTKRCGPMVRWRQSSDSQH